MRRRRALAALPLLAGGRARGQALEQTLMVAGSRIELQFDDGFAADLQAAARAWVERSAAAVARWLGRFPLARTELLLQAVDGAGVKGGTTFGEPEPYVRIRLGRDTRADQLADDRVLVHEMLHLAMPRLDRAHQWLHEGMATYAEGALRVHVGQIPAPQWWGELLRGLPQGQPAAGDRGLDHTPTWARTYWGGALFCLQADVAMRRLHLQRGLRQALQGVQAAGGSYAVAWPLAQLLQCADAAVGGPVLMDLYALHRAQAVNVDLTALWRDLGVDTASPWLPRLDDRGPLAAVRQAITG